MVVIVIPPFQPAAVAGEVVAPPLLAPTVVLIDPTWPEEEVIPATAAAEELVVTVMETGVAPRSGVVVTLSPVGVGESVMLG